MCATRRILRDGFSSVEEAEAVLIEPYNSMDFSSVMRYQIRSGLPGTNRNCVGYSLWFLQEFTIIRGTDGNPPARLGNGNQVAQNLYEKFIDKYPKLKKCCEPSVYSLASWSAPKPNTSTGNHTGVVVGINGDKILIAEACYSHEGGKDGFVGVYDLLSFVGENCLYINVNEYMEMMF